ncbi:F-actin capping protein, beta subunit [Rhizoclosmatium globosum]|uniref:F-actin-capping protein subunit beta n=1 Tax=Rhizoclosmatium globosum TaxID=329046 RepID=A0A1Y2BTQ0_9FUNG|nr:F-actin capping protein, beta subunit [Rhizoclosmatium globosum]|eukprot:ORY38140.1 F-actin capping protein, beta subunit [Rhizoclosmatium globosum]
MSEEQFDLCLDLMRRLSPANTTANLARLVKLVGPELEDELFSACPVTNKDYLQCDYNRDEKSYRSPWSNEYDPPLADGTHPSARLRKLEVAANDAFEVYRELYYEGGISSVYLWDTDEKDVFAGVVLIKKVNNDNTSDNGSWDSIHVIEVEEKGPIGELNLSGNMTRQAVHDLPVEDAFAHVGNIGRIVEDMELKMRNALHEIYFGKTKDIANDLRSVQSLAEAKKQASIQAELVGKLLNRK